MKKSKQLLWLLRDGEYRKKKEKKRETAAKCGFSLFITYYCREGRDGKQYRDSVCRQRKLYLTSASATSERAR